MNNPFGNPFGFPIMFGPHPMMHDRERPIDRIPARVAVALNLAERLGDQLSTRLVGTGVGAQEFDSRGHEPEERQVFIVACKTICSYLDGSFRPTQDEQSRTRQIPVLLAKCIGCEGNRADCELCGGSGSMKVVPARLGE